MREQGGNFMDACSTAGSYLSTFFLDNICRRKRWSINLAVTHRWACAMEVRWDSTVKSAPSQAAAVNL